MIKPEDLLKRKWPKASATAIATEQDTFALEAEGYRESKRHYVREGSLSLRTLGKSGFGRLIPPGECAITALLAAPSGLIFGATSGTHAHFFVYDKGPDADFVVDVGRIEGVEAIRALASDSKDNLWGATESGDSSRTGLLFRYPMDPVYAVRTWKHGYRKASIEPIGTIADGKGVSSLVCDGKRDILYALTSREAALIGIDLSSRKPERLGVVDKSGDYSRLLVISEEGMVYGLRSRGEIYRFSPGRGCIEGLGTALSEEDETSFIAESMVLDRVRGKIFIGARSGVLFSFDLGTQRLEKLGTASRRERIRTLTVVNDGRVFGVAGNPGGLGKLFVYEPDAKRVRVLGIPRATVQRFWHGYEFDASCTGRDGEIYLGESDRISHLFIYHPPIA